MAERYVPAKTLAFPVDFHSDETHRVRVLLARDKRAERAMLKALAKRLGKSSGESDPRVRINSIVEELQSRKPDAFQMWHSNGQLEATVQDFFKKDMPMEFLYQREPSIAVATWHRASVRSLHGWGFRVRLPQGVRSFSWAGLHSVEQRLQLLDPYPYVEVEFPREPGKNAGSLKLFSSDRHLTRAWG